MTVEVQPSVTWSLKICSLNGAGLGVGYLTRNAAAEASSLKERGCERKLS